MLILSLTLGLAAVALVGFLLGKHLGGRSFARDCYPNLLIYFGGLIFIAAVGMAATSFRWPLLVRPIVIAVAVVGGSFIVTMTPVLVVYFVSEGLKYRRSNRYNDFVHCPTCGYNLTGNVSGICSECGTPVPERIRSYQARQPAIRAT
ncbi:MAG: hypothetical protein ACE5EQ_01580 [Phycisphaerae bacterium]